MNAFIRPGRVLAALALGAIALLAAAPAASAHAGIESSSPRNGAQLHAAPKSITLAFGETVRLDGTGSRLIDGHGVTVAAAVRAEGHTVTFVPRQALAAGRYVAAWHLISTDGDAVEGAIAFTIAQPNPRGHAQAVNTRPAIPTTLNGDLPGSRTLRFLAKGRTGDVEWTSARLPEALAWTLTGNGTKATATGVLPWAGTWSFNATMTDVNGNVLIVKGTVRLRG
jgi:methionine-rich copper-binding protein CopC